MRQSQPQQPTLDPTLLAEQNAAQNQANQASQQALGAQSLDWLRQFGQKNAMGLTPQGGLLSVSAAPAVPFSTVGGGFATPFLTGTGSLASGKK